MYVINRYCKFLRVRGQCLGQFRWPEKGLRMKRQGIPGDVVECPDGFRFARALAGGKQKRHWHKTKRRNAKGEPIQVCLLVWQANCAKCGAMFERSEER